MSDLRAVVVIDYQNVHLTGHGLFACSRYAPAHEALVDPLLFANQLIAARNYAQRPGMDAAVLHRVLVYRGQPSAEHDPKPYARNQAQKAQWERDPRITVTLRPLKYQYERDQTGRTLIDAYGKKTVKSKSEKGVDVLCALALVREARLPDVDLVILASQDSDLEPPSMKRWRCTPPRWRRSAGLIPYNQGVPASYDLGEVGGCGIPASVRKSSASVGT